MTDKVEFCKNCKRDIAAANFRTHSVHCERNIQLCSLCAEPVPRNDMEQHLMDSHSREACTKCNLDVERCYMERHKEEECSERLHPCNFCDLELPIYRLKEHINFCGTRTETCPVCRQHIMCKDLKYHSQNCQKGLSSIGGISCDLCGGVFSAAIFLKHIETCSSQNKKLSGKFATSSDEKKPSDVFKRDITTVKSRNCEYCMESYPETLLFEHFVACGAQTEECKRCNTLVMRQEKEIHPLVCKMNGATKRPKKCEYCQEFYPDAIFVEHITACGARTERCLECNTYVMNRDKEMHPLKCKKKVSNTYGICPVCKEQISWVDMNIHSTYCAMSRGSLAPDDPVLEQKFHQAVQLSPPVQRNSDSFSARSNSSPTFSKLKQCAFCKEKFPDLIFADHREECSERPYNCEVCLKAMPFKDKQKHERHCRFSVFDSRSERGANASAARTNFFQKDTLLPCEYCQRDFPTSKFQEHASTCGVQKINCHICNNFFKRKDKQKHEYECRKEISRKPIACAFCKILFPSDVLPDHEVLCETQRMECRICKKSVTLEEFQNHLNVCKENTIGRSVSCVYCKISLPYGKMTDHLETCGTKTEKCPKCNCFIMLKEQKNHPSVCRVDGIKKRYKGCSWCHNQILSMEFDKHLEECCHRMKKCNFCQGQIPAVYEEDHLQSCVFLNPKNNYQTQTRGKKKNHNHGKPTEDKSLFKSVSSLFRGGNKKHETPIAGYTPPLVPEVAVLPCEFCDNLFPEDVLIEHQSGCRPDLMSFPQTEEPTPQENKYTDGNFKITNPKPTRVLDKSKSAIKAEQNAAKIPEQRDTLHRNLHASSGIKPGEFVENYNSTYQSGSSSQSPADLVGEAQELRNTHLKIVSNSDSTANGIYKHAPLRELKAVGAERAEKRGIIQVSRDTILKAQSEENTSYSVSQNQITRSSENCYTKEDKNNSNLNKINFSESIFSFKKDDAIPNTKHIVSKKTFSEECNKTDSLLKNSEVNRCNEYTSPSSKHLTKDDAKNLETFGYDTKNCNNGNGNYELASSPVSETEDKFFDAEDWKSSSTEEKNYNFKAKNIGQEDSSSSPPKDCDLGAYFDFLKNDKVEEIGSNGEKIATSIPTNCRCGNVICYCSVTNQPFQLSERNSFSNEASNFKGARPKKKLSIPDLMSNGKSEPMSAETLTNLRNEALLKRREESQAQLDMGSLSKEVDLNSPAWKVWRNKKEYDTDSD